MKTFTSLREFRYALFLALACSGWILLFHQWQAEQQQQTRQGWEGEASFILLIPAFFVFVCTGLAALAYVSHAWQRWRNPFYPRAGVGFFVLLFMPAALIYLRMGLTWLIERF
ncbi:hypothetical protein SAMN06265337_4191 [Hymenobacter gelipurpurascens]|uniref:Uncharacterized protein n=1 Tax=Hymenobacter gelipurpurascens TaxID=89968 RepID=A0A212UH57_9BACT|nr:hypothetical protein [Hymenobacter gelipurpurascens]SNC77598.1 hypothetical protein SAMN06265337_4191 [Hymenobacter gelipurpurascens]